MSKHPRHVLITGGSRGLGRATTRLLSARGAHVTVCARDGEALTAAYTDLSNSNPPKRLAGDVTDAAFRDRLIQAALDPEGHLDILINNAGTVGLSPMPELDSYPIDALRDVFETNTLAPLALFQLALPHLRRPGGQIVNITSDAAIEGYLGWGGYGASKAALELITHTLATELDGIRVVAFDPGEMNTQAHQEAEPGADLSGLPTPEPAAQALVELLHADVPVGTNGWRTTADDWEAIHGAD